MIIQIQREVHYLRSFGIGAISQLVWCQVFYPDINDCGLQEIVFTAESEIKKNNKNNTNAQ